MTQQPLSDGQPSPNQARGPASSGAVPQPGGRPPTRREVRKQQTRQRLLTAARELFVSQGFDETSFDDIARAAGVSRQTAFNHFPRKDDFVAAWVSERREELQAAMGAHDADASAQRTDAATRLLIIMRVMANAYEDRPEEGRVFMIAWVNSGGPFEAPVAARLFATVVRDGQRDGEFAEDIDAQISGEVIRAVYFDVLWRWASPDNEIPRGGLFEALMSHLQPVLTGLCIDADRHRLRQSVTLARSLEAARLVAPGSLPTQPDA
ncbi:TetR/AcrR family transcriptional regulator [Streptomyces sp. NPDC102441]|uniref:TetR/AcrR family transcriptional regulator n=1 Tax=Streptomyces sp. NPDC102441 TaxID=3366176 RepID=UPI003810C4AA